MSCSCRKFHNYLGYWGIFICLLLPSYLSAQQYHLPIQKFIGLNLPNTVISGLCEDARGFIWFSSDNNLYRFDGRTFTSVDIEKNSLYNNNIRTIVSSPDSMIWIQYGDAINQLYNIEAFNPITNEIVPIDTLFPDDLPFSLRDSDVKITQNKSGNIWVRYKNFLFEYDGKKLRQRCHFPTINNIGEIRENPDKTIWVRTLNTLFHIDVNGNILGSDSISSGRVELLYTDKESNLYYLIKGPSEPAVVVKKQAFSVTTLETYPIGTEYKFFLFVPQEKLFIGAQSSSDTELDLVTPKGKIISRISTDEALFSSRQVRIRTKLLWDSKGRLWFPKDKIIISAQVLQKQFQQHLYSTEQDIRNSIRGITTDAYGNLYVNSGRNFIRTSKDSSFTLFKLPKLTQNHKFAVYAEPNGWVWFYNRTHWVTYNHEKKECLTYPLDSFTYALDPSLCWAFHRDSKKRLWLAHSKGLSFLDTTCNCVRTYHSDHTFSTIFHIHENKKGLWLLTSGGVYLMDLDYNIIAHYHNKATGKYFLKHNVIPHLFEDKKGNFWLASKGGGLIKWSPETGEQQQFTTNDGLSNNTIYAVYSDDNGNLWLSTNKGINCFNINSHEAIYFTKNHGVSDLEYNTIAHHKDASGQLFFGSLNGVTSFYPKEVLPSPTPSSLALASIHQYNNKTQQNTNITNRALENKSIEIFPSTRETVIRFALLEYLDPESTQYAYKIEGLDKSWQSLRTPEIHLAGLPYGTYSLYLTAKSTGHTWHQKPIKIELTIYKPFYFQLWFIILAVVLLIWLIYVFVQFRLKYLQMQRQRLRQVVANKTATIQEQTEKLKALDAMKSQFFVNVSHELRTPLTLIMAPLTNLINGLHQKKQSTELLPQLQLMQRNGNRLMHLVEEILDISKLEANKVDLKEQAVQLKEFCIWLTALFEPHAQQKKLDFSLNYELSESLIVQLDKTKVEKILINLLSNAFKFTPNNGQITFKVTPKKQYISFTVQDSGRGIPTEDLPYIFDRFYQSASNHKEGGTGIGLALSKELALLMQGDLSVVNNPDQGCSFTFSLPLIQSDENIAINSPKEEVILSELAPLATANAMTAEASHPSMQILIVEDNQDMRYFLKTLLQGEYQIVEAEDGLKAKEHLEQATELPNLIISDIMMPNMNGMEFLKWLKGTARFAATPIVMLTAKSNQEDKLQALRIGVDDYLTKPFSPEELFARIRNLLVNAQSRQIAQAEKAPEEAVLEVKEEEPAEQYSEKERNWLKELERVTQEMVEDERLEAEALAKAVNMSLRTLQRKLKRLTGLSITAYFREVRLQKAREFLEQGEFETIAETAYASGFGTPYYFSKLYEERFGRKVSSYFKG